jgi:hypothetical protein
MQMINPTDDNCEKFELASSFWCSGADCWIDLKICIAKQNREADECKKCRQKRDILEIRRFTARQVPQSRPKILIRRENTCEKTVTL